MLIRLLVAGVVVAAAFDTATFYMLPTRGAGEANPLVLALGPIAVAGKFMLAAGIIWAVTHHARYSPLVGLVAVGAWSFGAYVNGL